MKNTIKSAAEISLLFETADRVSTKTLLAFIASNTKKRDQRGRVAFIAGKKLGNAPTRSRAKRLMREAAHTCGLMDPPRDLMLVARAATTKAGFIRVVKDLNYIKTVTEGKITSKSSTRLVEK